MSASLSEAMRDRLIGAVAGAATFSDAIRTVRAWKWELASPPGVIFNQPYG